MQSPRLPGLIEVETSTSSSPPSSPVLETAEVTAPRSAVNKRSGTRQQPTARLPRYSQLSDGPRSDDGGDGNDVNWTQLNRLPRVARGLPPRYSTGRIPSDLPSECSDAAVESETASPRSFSNFVRAGGQATGIVFLFVATVQLVMGIIFSIVAAKARALAPEFDESYEWTGILVRKSHEKKRKRMSFRVVDSCRCRGNFFVRMLEECENRYLLIGQCIIVVFCSLLILLLVGMCNTSKWTMLLRQSQFRSGKPFELGRVRGRVHALPVDQVDGNLQVSKAERRRQDGVQCPMQSPRNERL